ncbi:ABC-2 type transport system permease protein [Candidatus Kryptobacter tengchongensis]|nr:ABC-2 type transport system permease protein [Candidatus Kryptobacter tengchongensis]CUU02056.1 ABC-2 type transport system permease protein [Candidatus Kryptobacter tengchongensis]
MFSLLSQKIKTTALLSIVLKEFIQLIRDPRSIIIIIFIPLFLLIVFGYGVTMDVKNASLVVCDLDKTQFSRRFIDRFTSSGFFNLYSEVEDINEIDNFLISGKAKVGVVIPLGFSAQIGLGRPAKIQIIIDGSDANTANVVLGYVRQIIQGFSGDIVQSFIFKKTGKMMPVVDLKPRIWFNPELKSVNFFIPGLMGLIMMIMTVLMSSLSISRERELGSFEKLISTPLNPFFIITGKTIPYAILAFFDSVLILFAGIVLFNLKVKGSIALLFLVTIVFILCGLNLGLIISTVAKTQQSTMALAFISTVVPTFVLSDFVFPVRNMPFLLRLISCFIPARYYLEIIRGIILKGNGIKEHIFSTLILCFFMSLTFIASAVRLKKLMREI